MHAENLFVNDGCNWEAVETVGESLPKFDVVTSLALIIEAIDSVDGSTLMVPSKHEEVLWVLDLVCKKKADVLQRLFSSVHIIT